MPDVLGEELENTMERMRDELASKGISEDEIIKYFSQNRVDNTIEATTAFVADEEYSTYKEKMYEIALVEQAKTQRFLGHHEEIWGRCFAASHAMYVMAIEFAEDFSEYVAERISSDDFTENRYIYLVLQHIHGRACQEFLEILYLMRLGFADCAFSRWRSLYELSCLAFFIKDQPNIIAKQYYEQAVDGRISQSLKESYSWATGAIDKTGKELKINSFRAIQDYVAGDDQWKEIWYPQYHLANAVTHGSPEGTFGRLADDGTKLCILIGHSDYGIASVAENAAISLNMVTACFLTVYPHMDSIAHLKTFEKWVNLVWEMYQEVEENVFDTSNDEEGNENGLDMENEKHFV